MSVNIVVPEMGESIVDARIARWLKKEGDAVAVGEPLVELETDKVDVEVNAPQNGVLKQIAHAAGADVKIGDVIGTIAEGAGSSAAPASGARRASHQAPATRIVVRSSKPAATPRAVSLPQASRTVQQRRASAGDAMPFDVAL